MVEELQRQNALIVDLSNQSGLQISIPATYKEAIVLTNKSDWLWAIDEEMASMKTEDIFTPVNLKNALQEVPNESILGTRWIFTKKPHCFKARLVARGFRQIHGINYDEMFAPTPTFSSLRLLFSIACLKKWNIRTFDVKVAFLHSLIDKSVYVWPPMGMDVPKYSVLKLNKALYGTKQSSQCWWLHLRGILQRIGFRNNEEDPSTYRLNDGTDQAILWIHVDDRALTASSPSLLDWISRQLDKFLKIKWDEHVTGLIVAKMTLPTNCQLESNNSVGNMDKPYLKRIGVLLYIAQACRPDISFAVNYLARFSLCTNRLHWNALEHLIAYLRGTRDMGILISKSNVSSKMKCFVDANWGGEANQSTHGYIIMHGINPIGWQSKRQTTIASLTAQSEYMALSFAAKEVLWIYNLFSDILKNPVLVLLSDICITVGISTKSMNQKQTRHLIKEFNTINEFIATHKLQLNWVSNNEQLADILTKSPGCIKNAYFVSRINYS
ncbi:hypothetical protein O181_008797 [Austropuccinia psidii MF-1]|uniref:Reverse transcriptase Ty1/copia-type domain-containing protein n=1 Tax=Austropuccinia psidii MF-1 TaxID=1389203 RepID=A0A9Q3BQG2_9BASI|nr:hypothetical protein [Austropuccinia psidii MF-1]